MQVGVYEDDIGRQLGQDLSYPRTPAGNCVNDHVPPVTQISGQVFMQVDFVGITEASEAQVPGQIMHAMLPWSMAYDHTRVMDHDAIPRCRQGQGVLGVNHGPPQVRRGLAT